ncbi:MAG: hypothetical protein P4K83_12405 [Terracidiphilus sp.]|nr:hypothetical protein [Terracidiphilus sp.]
MTKSLIVGKKFSKEAQLLTPVAEFAKRSGFRLQLPEMPFYEYRIDLYGFSKSKDATVAIELKLHDWKRALEQAMLYQLCSDFVYIAMPEDAASRVDLPELEKEGVGLLAVQRTGKCCCVLSAPAHREVRSFYRGHQIEYLRENVRA